MKVYLKVALPRRFGGQETPPRTLDNNCVAFAPNVSGAEATQNTHKHSLALSHSLSCSHTCTRTLLKLAGDNLLLLQYNLANCNINPARQERESETYRERKRTGSRNYYWNVVATLY